MVGNVVVAAVAALKKTGKGLPMMGEPSRSTWTM